MIPHGSVKVTFCEATEDSEAKLFFNDLRCEVVGTVIELTDWLRAEGVSRKTDARRVNGVVEYILMFGLREKKVERFNARWVIPYVEEPQPFDPAERACRTKKRCETREEAMRLVISTMLSPSYRAPENRRFTAYACEHCGGWHAGHTRYHREFPS